MSQREKRSKWLRVHETADASQILQTSISGSIAVNKHIMISYNKYSRDLCMRIKNALEAAGFSIWIDVEDIHGSSLESMSQAIEDSELVLICMSQKYKESLNCRAEAEYVFQMQKPFIPLIMESGYKPSGWLGILLGSRIYVDFTKYEFDECLRRLSKEIVVVYEQVYNLSSDRDEFRNMPMVSEETIEHVPSELGMTSWSNLSLMISSRSGDIADKTEWTATDVDKWLDEKQFHEDVIRSVRPSNGKLLYSMYKMLETAPEAFYASLNKSSSVTLRDLVYFSSELKNLYSF
jgi:hypothetical protein